MIACVRNSSVLRAAEAALVDELVAPLLDLVGVTFDEIGAVAPALRQEPARPP